MCGIAGLFLSGTSETLPDLRERLRAMSAAQSHRGPDDEGLYFVRNDRGGLANCRLAIRDLSPAGHMPMGNTEGTVWITYNGEIYNTDELRSALERAGGHFRSQSDTEVILQGYLAWGERVVERLRGMFAFAILDTRKAGDGGGRLFLARDRLGVKPLYYACTSDAFLFASELKALQASGLLSREVSPAGLVGYLMMGSVPNPLTIYRDVVALDAGCSLSVRLDATAGKPEPERYWSLPAGPEDPHAGVDVVAPMRALLEEAVRTELVSDVPLGAFLSGGLDSSAIVALMRQATAGPIRTCSMVFEEAEYSEAPYARSMAESVGAEHYERVITAADVAGELDRILWAMDQPTVDGVNTYFVSKTAREAGLTVALSGLGGDELFGGYDSTFQGVPQMLRALTLVQAVPGGRAVAQRAARLFPLGPQWTRTIDALAIPASPASAYLTRRGLFSPSEVRALVAPAIWEEAQETFDPIQHVASRGGRDGGSSGFDLQPFAWTSRAELGTYTLNQLLRDTDVMSMAQSLEVRVPLLDHSLVEAVLRLPASAKQAGSGPKPLLRASLNGVLPEIIRERRVKQGFVFPLDRWMRGPLQDQITSLLRCVAEQPWLRRTAVDGVCFEHQTGRLHWSRAWALVALRCEALAG